MNKEEKLLINICQACFGLCKPDITKGIDWTGFYELAKTHNLVGICQYVFDSNSSDIPDDVRSHFLNKFVDLVFIANAQLCAYKEAGTALADAEIPFVAVKGIVLKELYPVPEARTMGDVDILIKENDRKRIKNVLGKIGFEPDEEELFVDSYKKGAVVLEVHTRLADNFENAFDNADFNGFEGRLNNEYHLAYLIAHIAKHLKHHGAGIRLLMDIAYMLKENDIDYDRLFNELERIGLLTFGKVLISVCSEWFGCGAVFTSDTERIKDYFISYGVFGANKDYEELSTSRLIQIGAFDNGKKSSAVGLKLRLAFPAYRVLEQIPYLHFIRGRRWLTPFAWIYRILYNLKNNPHRMKNMVKGIKGEATAAYAEDELEFFEEIGLI